jgi:hypothetical protein
VTAYRELGSLTRSREVSRASGSGSELPGLGDCERVDVGPFVDKRRAPNPYRRSCKRRAPTGDVDERINAPMSVDSIGKNGARPQVRLRLVLELDGTPWWFRFLARSFVVITRTGLQDDMRRCEPHLVGAAEHPPTRIHTARPQAVGHGRSLRTIASDMRRST